MPWREGQVNGTPGALSRENSQWDALGNGEPSPLACGRSTRRQIRHALATRLATHLAPRTDDSIGGGLAPLRPRGRGEPNALGSVRRGGG